jgi:hypothetical protein
MIPTARSFFDTASGCFTQFPKLLLDAFPTWLICLIRVEVISLAVAVVVESKL